LKLKAYSRMANWIEAPRLSVTPGETRAVDIVYSGPRNSNRITVSTSCYPLYVMSNPEAGLIQLVGPDGSRRTLQTIEGSSQSYAFDDLTPGEYVVEIDDPRYLPFTSAPVTPGNKVSAKLQPCSLLVLDVRDVEGAALVPDQVTVEFLNVNFMPREIVVHDGSQPFSGEVRLFPGDYFVHVQAGEQRGIASVAEMGFNETRPVTLTLGNQARLAGRLMRADSSALSGTEVLLLAPAREEDSDASPILGPNSFTSNDAKHRKQLAVTTSDDQGAFEFLIPAAGSYIVHADGGSGLAANSPVLALGAEESRTDLELVLPLGAAVSGRLIAPANALAGLRLWIGPVSPDAPFLDMNPTARAVAADGSFHLDGLPAGTLEARLLLPFSDAWQFAWHTLGTLELAAGQTLSHDFTLTEAPGHLTLNATVNGAPHPGVRVTLTRQTDSHQQRIQTALGQDGALNAQPLFAGTWSVLLADPGREWSVRGPDILVPSSGAANASVAITLASGTLRFLDAQGQPLADKLIRYELDTPDEVGTIQTKKTDAEGRASFLLAPGDYLFSVFTRGATELPPGTRLTWTSTGPTVSDVQL
jgi:5-hydroxyisourate hydrolase-like protein (transthyretin family)